jgi:hypothetical protein
MTTPLTPEELAERAAALPREEKRMGPDSLDRHDIALLRKCVVWTSRVNYIRASRLRSLGLLEDKLMLTRSNRGSRDYQQHWRRTEAGAAKAMGAP